MIIPYYNCLLLGHKYNEIELAEEDEELIKDYLQEYLTKSGAEKEIQVTCLGLRNANIISRVKNILHVLMTNLSVAVYQLGKKYTTSEEQHCFDAALREIMVKPNDNKGPAILENLSALKLFFSTYRSEEEMKAFLKQLLIKEVNHERRCIAYREAAEVKTIIQDKLSAIKGNVIITQRQSTAERGQIFIIMVNQKSKEVSKLSDLIKAVEVQFPMNKQVNILITEEYTLHYLRKSASQSLYSLFAASFSEAAITVKQQANALKDSMVVWANMKTILREGLRLAEEEKKLHQQFLQFVAAMNTKYTNEVKRYLSAFKDYTQFKRQERQYFNRNQAKQTVSKYLKGIIQHSKFKSAKEQKQHWECSMIQHCIRSFLETRRQEKLLMNSYLQQKHCIKKMHNEQYQQLITQINQQQLHKLSLFNRHKYGFSCCLYIFEISNKTNHYQFQPSCITKMFRKASKRQQLFTKIRCSDHGMQVETIQGKAYQIGYESTSRIKSFQETDSGKENIQSNNNSYQSIINQFDSISQGTNSRMSLSSSSFKPPLAKKAMADKEKCTKNVGKDYEFKIDEYGKLYGKGSNKNGQLGIDSQQNVPDFTLIIPLQKIRKLSTDNCLTIVVTASNKIFHFGKGRGKLQSSRIPVQLKLRDKFISKQVVITDQDVYFLTDLNKVYSLFSERTVRIPKEMEMAFDEFRLIKTGGSNIQCTYLLGFWVNSLDAIKRAEIEKYLTGNSVNVKKSLGESMLVEEEDLPQKGKQKDIHQLSAILQESSF